MESIIGQINLQKETLLQSYCKNFLNGNLTEDTFLKVISLDFGSKMTPRNTQPTPVRLTPETNSLYVKRDTYNSNTIIMPRLSMDIEVSNNEKYQLKFPLELTNLDYIRRILDMLQDPLHIFVNHIGRICPVLWDEKLEGRCVYYLIKYLKNNINIWAPALGIHPPIVMNHLEYLHNVRNSFSHTKGDIRSPKRKKSYKLGESQNVRECFDRTTQLLTIISVSLGPNNLEFSQRNIENLERQYNHHRLWKQERKTLMD